MNPITLEYSASLTGDPLLYFEMRETSALILEGLSEDKIKAFYQELKEYKISYSGKLYPGRDIVEEGIKLLEKLLSIDDELQFFEFLIQKKEDLLDIAEDIEPVRSFFKGQVSVFDRALSDYNRFVNDKPYLTAAGIKNLEEMNRIFNLKEPYKYIKDLPLLAGNIAEEHSKILADYRKTIIDKISLVLQDIREILERNKPPLNDHFAESIISYYTCKIKEIDKINDCVKLKALTVEIEEWKSTSLKQIDEEIERHQMSEPAEPGDPVPVPVKKIEQIKTGGLAKWNKVIETEDELEEYIVHLRGNLQKILDEKKRIRFV